MAGVGALVFGLAVFFWFAAMLPFPGGAPCTECEAPVPDPFAFAYSLPALTAILLLLPAVVAAVLAVGSRPTMAARRPA
jgi:hypothetical protein